MSVYNRCSTQDELILQNLKEFYKNKDYLKKMISIVNGESKISLRIVDWFVTNYAKKYFTVYDIKNSNGETERFKVYNDYKLKLKAYSKKRFDPFCRWDRIQFPYDENNFVETTIGQLNFFKWSLENNIIQFIEQNYQHIDDDQNARNSTSKKKHSLNDLSQDPKKTRKKREELSVSACKCIKKESVKIIVKFN
jgi:hypothetical protein